MMPLGSIFYVSTVSTALTNEAVKLVSIAISVCAASTASNTNDDGDVSFGSSLQPALFFSNYSVALL